MFRRQYENNDRNGEAVKLLRGETKCPFGKDYFCQLILLFSLFLLLFMGLTVLFQLTFTVIYSTFNKKFSVSTK